MLGEKMRGILFLAIPKIRLSWVVLILLTIAVNGVLGQKPVVKKDGPLTASVREYNQLPEAMGPCVLQECVWWNELRQAGNDLQQKGDEKSKKRFALLFAEGLVKAYPVPLEDRPPQVLLPGRVVFPDAVIAQLREHKIKSGAVEFAVEFRADGSVGDVKLISGIEPAIDASVIRAVRQNIFVPAVKDRAFVTNWLTSEMKISTSRK